MRHSIIIPHRNRNANLAICLWSIHRSAAANDITDYEVIVCDSHSTNPPLDEPNVRVIADNKPKGIFNKPRCQNLGIEASTGEVLSFIDADAIASRGWMVSINRLADHNLTRLCYRVRHIPATVASSLPNDSVLNDIFARYDTWPMAFEGYGRPEHNHHSAGPVFGNSHFSMRRDVLGDLRYNEAYEGAGYEDLWFIRETWMRNLGAYRAEIVTDQNHALLNIKSVRCPDWKVMECNRRNGKMYRGSWRGMERLLSVKRKRRLL